MTESLKNSPTRLNELRAETISVARRWVNTPYYESVEPIAKAQWENIILPFLAPVTVDMSHVLELAVGHGRMTQILLQHAEHVTGVDILQENIDFCSTRFSSERKLRLVKNDGIALDGIPDDDVSFVFCFDSMIHFDSDVVRSYLSEFKRIMRPHAFAFLHHSNLTRNPGGDFQRNAHARNFMSAELFAHYAKKEGLEVIKQEIIDWGQGAKRVQSLDCLTLLQCV